MRDEFNSTTAYDLGTVARNWAIENGEEICGHEKRRIELSNEAQRIEWRTKLKVLSDEREEIRTFLRGILHSVLEIRGRRRYYFVIALILGLAGLAFTHLALSPFGLGMQTWLYSAGLAIVCAVLTEMFLEKCGSVRIVQVIVTLAFIAGLTGLIILAQIRGDIVLLYLKSALSGTVPDKDALNGVNVTDVVQFYQESARKLRLVFSFLAASMELAMGLALWEARKIVVAVEDAVDRARQRLAIIDEAMPPLAARIMFLENEPQIFEAEFKRDFRRGLLQGSERPSLIRIGPLLLAALAGLVLARAVHAQSPIVVTVTDFSQSDDVATYDGGSVHSDNLEAAANTLTRLPSGARFWVIGITAESFSRPMILLSGQIPGEQGRLTFLNQIVLARKKYAADLRRVGKEVKATAATTDIFGSLMIAADIFGQSPRARYVLVIFGDMRQSASPVNIENPAVVPITEAMRAAERAHLVANLKNVEVFVYGVHAVGKNVAYWQSLRDFWRTYITRAGGSLQTFSMLREIPDFTSAER